VALVRANVSEEYIAPINRVRRMGDLGATLAVTVAVGVNVNVIGTVEIQIPYSECW
jgi:hypothetical protein